MVVVSMSRWCKAAVDLYVVRACVTESALPRMDWPSRFDARRAGTVH